jgi:hypothetical protein
VVRPREKGAENDMKVGIKLLKHFYSMPYKCILRKKEKKIVVDQE